MLQSNATGQSTRLLAVLMGGLIVLTSCSSGDAPRGNAGSGVRAIPGSSFPAPAWTKGTPAPAEFPCDAQDPTAPLDGPLDPASLFHPPRPAGTDAPIPGSSIFMGPRDGLWRDVQVRVLSSDGIVELDAKQGDGTFIGDIARIDPTAGTYTSIFRAGCAFGQGRWLVDGGQVFLELGNTLSMVELASGQLRWTIGWEVQFEPLVENGNLLAFGWDGKPGVRAGVTGMVRIDRATGQAGIVDTLESDSHGTATFADGWWWRRISDERNVTRLERISPTTRRVEAQVEAPTDSSELIVAEGSLWIADYAAHTLAKADLLTLKPTTTVNLPGLLSVDITSTGAWVQQSTGEIAGPVKDRRLLRSQLPAEQRDVLLSKLDLGTLERQGAATTTTGWFVSYEPAGGNEWLDFARVTPMAGGVVYTGPSPIPPIEAVDVNMSGSVAMHYVDT